MSSLTATQSEKEVFEILHRKRRNRVEHFFAKLRMYNFKFDGCQLSTSSIKVYFNFLMAQFAKEMEGSGAKWAAKKGKGKVPSKKAVATKRAREVTDSDSSDSSSSQSDSGTSSDTSSEDSDTPQAPPKTAPKVVVKVKAWPVLPPATAPPRASK